MSIEFFAPLLPGGRSASTPVRTTLISALDRLEEVLDVENGALAGGGDLDIEEINRRKTRSLLELSRAARALPPGEDAELAVRVGRLKDKLDENRYLVSVQLGAAQEVGAILDTALREAESDGTYSARPVRGETPR
ncbi:MULTISPECIES: hypothetical protein [unclassified Xanthobacter]|uniref:hypothetical protein n=1 Tax=unclassified Xanthobacter TaxID=2623496 RepID=UPI001EDE0389|nr:MULTISPECIES: hypothetical protein [unclassified Xanthobacter]